MRVSTVSIASVPSQFGVPTATVSRFAVPRSSLLSKGFGFSPLRIDVAKRRPKAIRASRIIVFSQLNDALKVIGIVARTANDGLEAGSKFVPESVPRPAAKAIVAVLGVLATSFLFSSILSTLSFVLGVAGIAYIAYRYFSKDNDSFGSGKSNRPGSTEASIEEARRIMDKYK